MATKILKKLTIREAIGGKAAILAYAMTGRTETKDAAGKSVFSNTGSPVALLRVLGQVTGFKAGESDYGSFVELRGAFQGTNLQTGEITDGVSKCILPDAIGEPLATAVQSGAEAVEFAVEIFVEFDESAATMYKFSATSLLKAQTPKPIESLMTRLLAEGVQMTKPLQLTAPMLSDADHDAQLAAGERADKEKAAKAAPAPAAAAAKPAAKTTAKA